MCSNYLRQTTKAAILAVTVLLLTAGVSSAQTVNLTASQQTTTTPDGNTIPMWGWTCGAVTQGTTAGATTGTSCTALTYTNGTLNPQSAAVTAGYALGGGAWQPPLIIVPYTGTAATATSGPVSTTNLTINLTNLLPVETSLMILGQAGGGLGGFGGFTSGITAGTGPAREAGPRTDGDHQQQTATTWTIVSGGTFTPPTQSARVRSMVPEIAGVATVGAAGAVGTYTWTGLKPGTYLIRTGTYASIQGPMGLYGVLVVTQAATTTAAGIAYPSATTNAAGAVTYDADVVALESEIDARQNNMVAALFPTACTGAGTPVAGCTAAGAALPAGTATANAGFSETLKWNLQCGAGPNGLTPAGTPPTCYPPAVDYTPMYFLANGIAFSKDNRVLSALPVPAPSTAAGRGNVLIRFVNAGSHMHTPSVNGLNMLLVAEDANVLPDVALALGATTPKALSANSTPPAACTATTTPACGLNLRTEVFQPAGKVMDVIVSPPTTPGTYMIYDRALEALTTNNARDGGMQAILDVADANATTTFGALNSTASLSGASYTCAPGVTLQVLDPGKGVIAKGNGVNIYGVTLAGNPANHTLTPFGGGSLTLNPNGTFVYTQPSTATSCGGTASYYANGITTTTYTLTITQSVQTGTVHAVDDTYNAKSAALLRVGAPGVLGNDSDDNGLPIIAIGTGTNGAVVPSAGLTVSMFPDGSFTAQASGAGSATCPTGVPTGASCFSFTYQAQNSQKQLSNVATATLVFPAASNLSVTVQDAPCVVNAGTNATALAACAITDYKWIIEQDLTFPINPACQVNTGTAARPAGCSAGIPPTPATNFHTSFMPVIAEGCTGPQSCSRGQTIYDAGVKCTSPGVPAGCSPTAGQHVMAACDGFGNCTIGATQLPASLPSTANLSATNPDGSPASYYISILSGDSQNSFAYANVSDPSVAANCTPGATQTEPTGFKTASTCGHTMGGAPIKAAATCSTSTSGGITCTGTTATGGTVTCTPVAPATGCIPPGAVNPAVVVNLQPNPLPTAMVTAFIFEDDYPLNGEPDTGGGVDSLATLEKPLGDFSIMIWDDAGGVGDFTGQMTYDMFNMPLTNALNGTIDPNTGFDACPIANTSTAGGTNPSGLTQNAGVIMTCPQYESDGKTPSPLTGQVVVKNLMQGKFSLIAHPGAAREAAGEEWLQTNSLDGGHFLDSFIKPGEPPYFAEFGPGGYHVFFGFANPAHINARLANICGSNPTIGPTTGVPFTAPCRNNLNGQVTNLHQDRSPSEQLFSGGVFAQPDPRNYSPLAYTNCFAAIGDTDGATIALAKCDPDGNFKFTNLPDGDYGLVLFDQWNDFIVDGSSRIVHLNGGQTVTVGFPTFTWQAHLWSRIYMDTLGQGSPNILPDGTLDPATSPGVIQVPTRIRQVNGKIVNTLLSDIGGNMRFDETFPLFAFYTVESDNTRFRTTGIHVVNDNGGQVDGPAPVGNGNTGPYQGILNSKETFSLPGALSVPGAVYCGPGDAPCLSSTLLNNANGKASCGSPTQTSSCQSTGRIDPGSFDVEGWQGGVSEFNMIDWGKQPYYMPPNATATTIGENGGIRGRVVNNTTRNFDDIRMQIQNLWEPLVPRVTINLYQEGTAPDGVTTSLKLVDSTQTTSWDDWAQGFHAPAGSPPGTAATIPNMSCTGQDTTDPFFTYTLAGTSNYLTPSTPLPNNSQYKCYDGYHNLNQLQPAPYDGQFRFPSNACLTGTTFTASVGGTATPVTGTCVTIANPAFGVAGQTGAAAKILPPGVYVVEVVPPLGWQIDKEEDLNLLIGDQYIAPVTSQFTGLGAIFITPDQASLDAANPSYTGPYTSATGVNGTSGPYVQPWSCSTPTSCTLTPNTTNNGKQSTDYGRTTFGVFAPGGLQLQSAPCVGRMRIVPDYLSISPESGEVSPFAGSLRPLCDRKEITLSNQMQADLEFNIYTNTPKTTSFTGFISDDFSSEFDPASPAFGEKFAVPNVPVSIRDFNGQEVSRVYSDQWGVFNGLVYSTWEVDPPNITGFSPNMMVTCMNDPGPIPDPNNPGQTMNDPNWNPAYSTFCYENPFMPGDTTYLDTPVVPVSAFAEGYNPPDCNYPDGTPMILSVKGDAIGSGATAGAGPWVSGTGHQIIITALAPTSLATPNPVTHSTAGPGIQVPNHAYSGPAASTQPYNQKFVTRHYGFGTTPGTVTIGGQTASCSWSDAVLNCAVPSTVPRCPLLQTNALTGAKIAAQCGELVITTGGANPKQSIDTVIVTIGGGTPTFVGGENAQGNAIQKAIDSAKSGDLIIVGCAANQNSCSYNEMLLMWKPLRLQGIGDGAVTINANAHPAGKLLQPWRRQVNCLFGLALNGGFLSQGNPYDPTGTFTCNNTAAPPFTSVDAIVGEPIVGWDATLNGNLAELLQEPTLMGAYEGAGITVLAKGLENGGTATCTVENASGCIPLNNSTATGGDCNRTSAFYPSNFLCNPSRIDGLTFTNSSQGGGGVYLHGFNHYTEVSNLNVNGNGGTLTGGITIGQLETVDPTLLGTIQQPMMYNHHVNIHNNRVTNNAAYGDELNSNTPASAGGVTICTGADYYNFHNNWVCGNWSSGDGGGVAHHGFIWNGRIDSNWIVFNQSINPSLVTNGGGLVVLGSKPDGPLGEAGIAGDVDVAPDLTNGTGPGLLIRNNVIQGNTAEEGQGGGLALMGVNGNDVANNPTTPGTCGAGAGLGENWYCVTIVDNVIANNVAGWTGGGVSLKDAVLVNFQNNTVVSNDSTSSAGVVFYSNGAPLGNVPPPGCNPSGFGCTGNTQNLTTSVALPAGLVTEAHSTLLSNAFATFLGTASATCPAGHTTTSDNKACAKFSIPILHRDILWQNRSFSIATNASNGTNAVVMSPNLQQTATGGCPAEPAFSSSGGYWDIGVYGDTTPNSAASGNPRLTITQSTLSSGGYTGSGDNSTIGGGFPHQYCNGSRVPPEIAILLCTNTSGNGNANAPGCIRPGAVGLSTWGGVPDSAVPSTPQALFSITSAATVDEGNNWINMFYGPLTLTCPITTNTGAASTCGTVATGGSLGDYTSPNESRGADIKANVPTYPNP